MKAQKICFSAVGVLAVDACYKLRLKAEALTQMGYKSFNVTFDDAANTVTVSISTDFTDDKANRLLDMFEFYCREYDLEQQKARML